MSKKVLENEDLKYTFVIDGASGFLAYELSNFFLDLNHNVILIGRSEESKFKRKNILKRSNVKYLNKYQKIPKLDKSNSIFIHTAASTPNNNNYGDEDIFLKNALLRNIVLEHILSNDYNLIVNISSTSVYGNIKKEIIYENHKTLPSNLYGLSKLLSENQFSIFSRFSSLSNLLHLRLPAIFSKESKGIFILRLINNVKNNKEIKIRSENSRFNNLTTSKDVAKTILRFIANREKLTKEVFVNMSSNDSLKLTEIISFFSEYFNKEFSKITYDERLGSFLLANNKNNNLINNSSLLDMIKDNLVIE